MRNRRGNRERFVLAIRELSDRKGNLVVVLVILRRTRYLNVNKFRSQSVFKFNEVSGSITGVPDGHRVGDLVTRSLLTGSGSGVDSFFHGQNGLMHAQPHPIGTASPFSINVRAGIVVSVI